MIFIYDGPGALTKTVPLLVDWNKKQITIMHNSQDDRYNRPVPLYVKKQNWEFYIEYPNRHKELLHYED
jgi:hypothetical protein